MSARLFKPKSRMAAGVLFGLCLAIAIGLVVSAQISPTIPASSDGSTVEQDRQRLKDFGPSRSALTAESAAELPDLYSSSLTADPSYSWENRDYIFRLNSDRILPLNQVAELGGESWSLDKKKAFSADTDNLSPTSHVANSWKGVKTPKDMLEAQNVGRFSWSDKCTDVFRALTAANPVGACKGLPEDFDSCGYAASYIEIADRYGIAIPREDRDALEKLAADCPSS